MPACKRSSCETPTDAVPTSLTPDQARDQTEGQPPAASDVPPEPAPDPEPEQEPDTDPDPDPAPHRPKAPRATRPVQADGAGEGSPDVEGMRDALQAALGLPVSIELPRPDGPGELRIRFASLKEVETLRRTLT